MNVKFDIKNGIVQNPEFNYYKNSYVKPTEVNDYKNSYVKSNELSPVSKYNNRNEWDMLINPNTRFNTDYRVYMNNHIQQNPNFQQNPNIEQNPYIQQNPNFQQNPNLLENPNILENPYIEQNPNFQQNPNTQQNINLLENPNIQQTINILENPNIQQNLDIQQNPDHFVKRIKYIPEKLDLEGEQYIAPPNNINVSQTNSYGEFITNLKQIRINIKAILRDGVSYGVEYTMCHNDYLRIIIGSRGGKTDNFMEEIYNNMNDKMLGINQIGVDATNC
jgi:hypothetical protein